MNRLLVLAPFALLTTACAVRTPATALDLRQEAIPPTREWILPSDHEALSAWHLPPESPWSRYEKLTLLSYLADTPVIAQMPAIDALDVVRRATRAAEHVGTLGVPAGTMWIVDLRGAASVAFGAALSQAATARRIAPVLTFNNWPAEDEVVPAEQTLAALVTHEPRPLTAADTDATPVFLLDAWRLALRYEEPDPSAVDNRYMLMQSDLPDATVLRAAGITRVVYVVEDRSESSTEEDDLHELVLSYQYGGIDIALVDLDTLASLNGAPESPPDWGVCFNDWAYRVQIRTTIFDDPAFYQRARGGFGAAPAGVRTYEPAHPVAGVSAGFPGHASHTGRLFSGASPHVSGHGGG